MTKEIVNKPIKYVYASFWDVSIRINGTTLELTKIHADRIATENTVEPTIKDALIELVNLKDDEYTVRNMLSEAESVDIIFNVHEESDNVEAEYIKTFRLM